MLRRTVGVTLKDRLRNEDVCRMAGMKQTVSVLLRQHRHMERIEEHRMYSKKKVTRSEATGERLLDRS